MKNSEDIRFELERLYNANDDYVPNPELEHSTLVRVKEIMNDPDNEFTEDDKVAWNREIRLYQEDEDFNILDMLDNMSFYIEQPEEYERINAWRI